MSTSQEPTLGEVLADATPGFACGDDVEDGVFQFRMNNITTEGQLDLTKRRRVPKDYRNIARFLVQPGDVLFNATNSPDLVGKAAFFPGIEEPAVFSNHFLRLRPRDSEIDGRYLARWLNLQFQRGRFKGMCRQWVNQATVSRDALLSLRIPLPRLPEQRRIAEILDKADALRAKRRAALAQLDTLTQSIFLDMFGDPATNPKGWPEVRLGEHTTKIGSGATPLGGESAYKPAGIALIRSMNVHNGRFSRDGLAFIDDQQAARLDGVVVQADDVLLNITGASVARVCRAPRDVLPARVNQHVAIIRPTSAFDPRFLEQCLLYPSMKRRLLRIAGAGATREAITKDAIERLTIIQPAMELQVRFADLVRSNERLEEVQRAHSDTADALFFSLQHRAFQGGF
jgi:type I restriction enzyme S subunit